MHCTKLYKTLKCTQKFPLVGSKDSCRLEWYTGLVLLDEETSFSWRRWGAPSNQHTWLVQPTLLCRVVNWWPHPTICVLAGGVIGHSDVTEQSCLTASRVISDRRLIRSRFSSLKNFRRPYYYGSLSICLYLAPYFVWWARLLRFSDKLGFLISAYYIFLLWLLPPNLARQ